MGVAFQTDVDASGRTVFIEDGAGRLGAFEMRVSNCYLSLAQARAIGRALVDAADADEAGDAERRAEFASRRACASVVDA